MTPLWIATALSVAWPVLGPEGSPTGTSVHASDVFVPADLPERTPHASWVELAAVADATERYLAAHPEEPASRPGLFGEIGVDEERVRSTLAFVAGTARTAPDELADAGFLREHFEVLRWVSDEKAASAHGVRLEDGRIRLTRYLVYELPGSPVKTEAFPHALYAKPEDDTCRLRFTRKDVLDGAYEPGGAAAGCSQALVWLTRDGVHQALMQGTVRVDLPDGPPRTFNVHENNGIPFDRGARDPEQQGRYWYFRETDGILGWGAGDTKVPVEPGVTVAGDVFNLGLGKVLLLDEGTTLRWVVLADTGGAFQPNLYQLDLLTGTFRTEAEFQAATAGIPPQVTAYVLLLKRQRL